MIPAYYFSGALCPECNQTLPAPERSPDQPFEITDADQDGDGIPDEWERTMNIDQKNAGHALFDPDADGFSSLYEFQNDTNPLIPRSHPPLWHRLKFSNVHLLELPVRFRALTAVGDDKANWDIQLDLNGRTAIKVLGDTIRVLGRRYKIADVERKIAEGDDQIDESKLYLVEETSGDNPEKITMQIGQRTFSSDQRAVFEDVSDPKFLLEIRPGDTFAVGTPAIGVENYRLQSFDIEKKIAVLEALDPNAKEKTVTIGADSVIPAGLRVRNAAPSTEN